MSGSRIHAAFKGWQRVEYHIHINFSRAAHWLCAKNGRELYYANLTLKELVKFSYIGCEIVLHFFREDAEESPFVNELVTRQLNETDWICNLIIRTTINTTRGENNT